MSCIDESDVQDSTLSSARDVLRLLDTRTVLGDGFCSDYSILTSLGLIENPNDPTMHDRKLVVALRDRVAQRTGEPKYKAPAEYTTGTHSLDVSCYGVIETIAATAAELNCDVVSIDETTPQKQKLAHLPSDGTQRLIDAAEVSSRLCAPTETPLLIIRWNGIVGKHSHYNAAVRGGCGLNERPPSCGAQWAPPSWVDEAVTAAATTEDPLTRRVQTDKMHTAMADDDAKSVRSMSQFSEDAEEDDEPHPKQAQLPVVRGAPFALPRVNTSSWTHMEIPGMEYVPDIGSYTDPISGKVFEPTPYQEVLAMSPSCARGKTTVFRRYIAECLRENPSTRILLTSANILYGSNLTAELKERFPGKVGFYKDLGDEKLSSCQIVVCSFESIHRVCDQSFDVVLMDEVNTLAGLVGGGTMPNFFNVGFLAGICSRASRIVCCDADLMFKIDGTLETTKAQCFLKLIAPERSVLHASLSAPPPAHLKRKVRIRYASPKAGGGTRAFFRELRAAAIAWHKDNNARFAVSCGTIPNLTIIYNFLTEECGVPVKPYHSGTDERSKMDDLKDPAMAWVDYGAVLSTTSLSIGVDPKNIKFARVFVVTSRVGCTLLAQFQAAMRYGRQVDFPLTDVTISVLVDCLPPGEIERRVKAGKMAPVKRPIFIDTFRDLSTRRQAARLAADTALAVAGGRAKGTAPKKGVSDMVLHVWTHTRFARNMQAVDHNFVLMQCIKHYDWEIEPETIEDDDDDSMINYPQLCTDPDDDFAAGLTQREKYESAINHITLNGTSGFFENNCYSLVPANEEEEKERRKQGVRQSGKEQFLVALFFTLRPVGALPDLCFEDVEEGAKLLEELSKAATHRGLELNAHMQCVDLATLQLRETASESDPDRDKRRCPHAMLRPPVGLRMQACHKMMEALKVPTLHEDVCMPQRVMDVIRRQQFRQSTADDHLFINHVKSIAGCMDVEMRGGGDACSARGLLQILRAVAVACGMRSEEKIEEIVPPGAPSGSKRVKVVKEVVFLSAFTEIVDKWGVYSGRLGYKIECAQWDAAHSAVMADSMHAMLTVDKRELDPTLFADATADATANYRWERIDSASLKEQIARFEAKTPRNAYERREHHFLQQLHASAQPESDDGTRLLMVHYRHARRVGRRIASSPSMQHCPAGMHSYLQSTICHNVDIADCRPTIALNMARRMQVDAPLLAEYVADRHDVLRQIRDHYDLKGQEEAKHAVLHVLNGDDQARWTKGISVRRNQDDPSDVLIELSQETQRIRDRLFHDTETAETAAALKNELAAEAMQEVQVAKQRLEASETSGERVERKAKVDEAKQKARPHRIEQLVFNHIVAHQEDSLLHVIDEHFRGNGWVVSSLMYGAVLVEHRPGEKLWTAMRGAEAAVEAKTEYKIKLQEKTLFSKDLFYMKARRKAHAGDQGSGDGDDKGDNTEASRNTQIDPWAESRLRAAEQMQVVPTPGLVVRDNGSAPPEMTPEEADQRRNIRMEREATKREAAERAKRKAAALRDERKAKAQCRIQGKMSDRQLEKHQKAADRVFGSSSSDNA